ncbi:MAG: extracellular solute-binding protein, partial [Candidatus Wallbacteria bacterium]|nr:extracellular solute-binding protein [Candidatus Wallbacteria bacterium]
GITTSSWIFDCMILQAGGKLISDDGKKALFNSNEARESLDYLIKTLKEVAYKTQGFDNQNDFIAGKNGIVVGSCVSKAFMEKDIKFNYGIAPLPGFRKNGVIVSGTNVVIFKKDPEKEAAAWKFLKWFTEPAQTAFWSLKTSYVPVRRSALETPLMRDAFAGDPRLKAPISQLEYSDYEPRMPEWYNGRQILEQTLDKALTEKGDSMTYLNEANEKINLELNPGK